MRVGHGWGSIDMRDSLERAKTISSPGRFHGKICHESSGKNSTAAFHISVMRAIYDEHAGAWQVAGSARRRYAQPRGHSPGSWAMQSCTCPDQGMKVVHPRGTTTAMHGHQLLISAGGPCRTCVVDGSRLHQQTRTYLRSQAAAAGGAAPPSQRL